MVRYAGGFLTCFLLGSTLCLFGCESQSDGGAADDSTVQPATPPPQPSTPDAADPTLAAEGEVLFTQRACASCHTIGNGRLVGPDLLGVTQRRTQSWVLAMILNPDSMIRSDSIARRLMGEYFTPMANQNLQRSEATALYHFLMSKADPDAAAAPIN